MLRLLSSYGVPCGDCRHSYSKKERLGELPFSLVSKKRGVYWGLDDKLIRRNRE